jgi:hypothetical protein
MQIAEQRIRLAEAQARMSQANLGPEMDFSADIERQKMSAEGLMGPFATDTDGNTGPWYTNGTFGLTAGWDLDLWGKNRAGESAHRRAESPGGRAGPDPRAALRQRGAPVLAVADGSGDQSGAAAGEKRAK